MSQKIDVLLVDDHEVVRKGMKFLLEDHPEIRVIGEASNGREAIEQIAILKPQVVLLDINMPEMNGIEAADQIAKLFSDVRVLIFSMHADLNYILKSVENGVGGYLLKDADQDEIIKAIKIVFDGGKYFPPDVSSILVSGLQNKTTSVSPSSGILHLLSRKELEILKMIADGKSSKEIATDLDLSIRTVSNHRANMLKKTNLHNTAELIRMASNEGL